MNYKEYIRIKIGNYQSVGMFGEKIYAYEVLTGFADVPEYHQISRQEFDTFEKRQNEKTTDLKILYNIINRKAFCSGYKGCSDFNENDLLLMKLL